MSTVTFMLVQLSLLLSFFSLFDCFFLSFISLSYLAKSYPAAHSEPRTGRTAFWDRRFTGGGGGGGVREKKEERIREKDD